MLRRCLEKDPKRRLSAIGDARLELEDIRRGFAVPTATAAGAGGWRDGDPVGDRGGDGSRRDHERRALGAMAAAAARPPVRISADIGIDGALAVNMGTAAVISPDAKSAVFVVQTGGRSMLYVRRARPAPLHAADGHGRGARSILLS